MVTREQINRIIFAVIDEMNALREENLIEKQLNTELFGTQSQLDSVDLVNLLVGIEEQLEDELNLSFVIANEKAMSLKNSPFRTVETLSDYLAESVNTL